MEVMSDRVRRCCTLTFGAKRSVCSMRMRLHSCKRTAGRSVLALLLHITCAQPQMELVPSFSTQGLQTIGEDKVVLCQATGYNCQSVDPCGTCGLGRCSNLDTSCLGEGLLKTGTACSLRWAEVPPGVEVTFYNLWGPWSSSTDDCAEAWTCSFWIWPWIWPFGCLQGSEPKETWIGPMMADLEGDRCAVKISVRVGFTCGDCPPGFYRLLLII